MLTLLAAGLSNAEIAQRLLVGNATVKTHINRIFTKTGAQGRAQDSAVRNMAPHTAPSGPAGRRSIPEAVLGVIVHAGGRCLWAVLFALRSCRGRELTAASTSVSLFYGYR